MTCPLHADHLEQLHDSAIADAIIAERGYRTVTEITTLARLDGQFAPSQRLVPCLFIPIYRLGVRYTAMIKPDHPRAEKRENGKIRTIKYEWPAGLPLCVDVLPRYRDQLTDAQAALWFTEGAKKADALASLGEPLVPASISGVWNWGKKNADGEHTLLPDFNEIALRGREVVLAFDSDYQTNHHVQQALHTFATLLDARRARVDLLTLPHLAQEAAS